MKCDGVQPCGRCKKSNAECVFAKLPPKRGPPKQYMESLENRLQRVEKALKSMTVVRKVFDEAEKKTKIPEGKYKAVCVCLMCVPKFPLDSCEKERFLLSTLYLRLAS